MCGSTATFRNVVVLQHVLHIQYVTKGDWTMGINDQVCRAGDKCVFYPHKSIPTGQEAWVLQSTQLAPYHPECTGGLFYFDFQADGESPVKVSPYFERQPRALAWLINQVHAGHADTAGTWSLKRAHGNDVLSVLREWAELQPLYAKASAYKEEGDLSQGDEIEADANETCKELMQRLVDALHVG